MGKNRSFEKLWDKLCHQNTTNMSLKIPSCDTLKRWSKNFNWQQRVEQRDIENNRALENKLKPETTKIIVNTKADYRAEIKTQLGILKAILNKVIKDFKNDDIIDVANTGDLKDIINSYEKLCKLDLLLIGEPTDRGKLDIDWGKINNEQLDKYIDILSKGGEVKLPVREEEKGDKS